MSTADSAHKFNTLPDNCDNNQDFYSEIEVETQIEEFRKKLEGFSGIKKKIKPNISNEWLSELQRRLLTIEAAPRSKSNPKK